VFHLNLAFSSIEEEDRSRVLERCYWPLLDLIRRYDLPFAVEATGYTLGEAAAIDPAWLVELRRLVSGGKCELVGSGYAQLIGPLVPAAVNAANQWLGMEAYERLVWNRPRLALVNEQAWSGSMVRHYVEAGYRGLMMEWDNPAAGHPEWQEELRYQPQIAVGVGQDRAELPLLWNHSIGFQKFQRYAHGELGLDEYLEYLRRHRGETSRVFTLYGSDAEVFDYRPGRYRTEAPLGEPREWARIGELCAALLRDPDIELVSPSTALARGTGPYAGHRLSLESAQRPVPVKKQPKYHLARWAITGRDDLGINTACWRAYERLRSTPSANDDAWRELCYLWSSDFRTHITQNRWQRYTERLAGFTRTLRAGAGDRHVEPLLEAPAIVSGAVLPPEVRVERCGRWLTIDAPDVQLRLNCRRGAAIDALAFTALGPEPLVGSLPHGYFDDIEWSADQYTGFLVHAAAGQPQITDLEPVEPAVEWQDATSQLVIHGCISTPLGPIRKEIVIATGSRWVEPRVEVRHRLLWEEIPLGTLRLGHVTLLPTAFDERTLFVATHNGGPSLERFALGGVEMEQLSPVSHLVSCRSGLGATEGIVVLGDAQRGVRIEIDKARAALFPMLSMRRIGGRYFCRITLSARELDDTSRHERRGKSGFVDGYAFAISPWLQEGAG
jgi:hypothetical protein